MRYQRNPDWDWESAAAGGMLGLVMLAAIVAAAVIATIIIVLTTEIARIYQTRAFQPTSVARVLWFALAGFLAMLLLAAILSSTPENVSLAALLASWGSLTFVLTVEVCDWYGRHFDGAAEDLEPLLTDWPHETSPVSANGHVEPQYAATS